MDLWATKNQQQRDDEEAERLVRPAPKLKPPRRDKRRERVDTERDPDLQGETDPDLSKNYKDVGGSVALRWLVAKDKKIPARNRDGEVVFISPDTFKEKPGEYEKLKPEDAEAARKEKIKGKIRKKREKKQLKKEVKREEKGKKPKKEKGKEAPEEPEEGKPKGEDEAPEKGEPKEEEEKGTPSEADKAGIGSPKRRAASEDEKRDAVAAVVDTFPPEVSADILSQDLHPDDIQSLVASFQASKSTPVGDLAKFTEGAKRIFETDPKKVKPPKTGKNAAGEAVPFDQLQPDEQAESYRQHQMQVVAFSMAAQHKITREMTMPSMFGEPRVPQAVAEKLAQATLGKATPPKRFVIKGSDVIAFDELSPKEQAQAEEKGEVSDFTEGTPEAQKEVMAILDAKRASKLAAEAHEAALASGDHVAIPDRVVKKLLKSLDPGAQQVAKGFLQANDYHEAKKLFLGGEGISEHDSPGDILGGLDKASAWFKKRAAVYGDKNHSVTSSFRVKVMGQLRSLDEKKFQHVRGSLDKRDAKTFDRAQAAWEKKQKAYEKQKKKWERSTQQSPEPKPPTDEPPRKPARYSMGRKPKELATEGKSLMDDLLSKVASSGPAARVSYRYVSTYEARFAMDHSSDSPEARAVRQAVYHGIDPAENYPDASPGWLQPNQARTTEEDLDTILTAARDWLKTPVLARKVPGLIKDQQYRAALDLGLKTSGYDRHIHPRVYNILLARLAGVPEDQTLLTLQASSTGLSREVRKVAGKVATHDPSLAYDLVSIASRMERQSPDLEDFWMSREAVAEVCPECAVKMASLNIRQIRASVLFGSLADKTAAKGDKWMKMPPGWTEKSRKKLWASLAGKGKHKVTACIKKMGNKVDDAGAFCAALADRVEGTAWRSREAAAPRGKAQLAIMAYLKGGQAASLDDMSSHPSFRGIHSAKIMSAAESLKKGGLIDYDGKTLTKKASQTVGYDELRSLVIRTAASDANARRVLMPILQVLRDLG